jgi:hypothetical protein
MPRARVRSLLFTPNAPNVLEHLFDCLDAVVPAEDRAVVPAEDLERMEHAPLAARQKTTPAPGADSADQYDIKVRDVQERPYLVLRVSGLPCVAARGKSDRQNPAAVSSDCQRVAIIECLQLQAQILSLIAGLLRAGWWLNAWRARDPKRVEQQTPVRPPAGSGGKIRWHQELGFFPYVLWRLMESTMEKGRVVAETSAKFHGCDAKFTLWSRISYASQHFVQEKKKERGAGTLYKLLRNKINSALKLALLSSLDMGWEGEESKLLVEGGGWVNEKSDFVCVSTQRNKSSQVVAAIMVARILTRQDHIEHDAFEGYNQDDSSIVARAGRTLEDVAEQMHSDATGKLGPSHHLAKVDEVFGRPPERTALFLFQAFEAVEALAKSSCLLTSTEVTSTKGCWESDWVEQLNRFGRQVLLESIGILCFALKYIAVEPPLNPTPAPWRANFFELYTRKGEHMLQGADDAVNAVIQGWPSLQETLEEKCAKFKEWRDSAHMEPNTKTPIRLQGLEFLLIECGKRRMQVRPKFGILRGPQKEPLNIQLTTIVNILFAVDVKTAIDADTIMADSRRQNDDYHHHAYEALLKDAAWALVQLGDEGLGTWFRLVKELLRRVVFCLSRACDSLDLNQVEKELVQQYLQADRRGANVHVDGTLQSALRHLAITAADLTYTEMLEKDRRERERRDDGTVGVADGRWKEVLELTLEAIGWYVRHAESEDATADGGEHVSHACSVHTCCRQHTHCMHMHACVEVRSARTHPQAFYLM